MALAQPRGNLARLRRKFAMAECSNDVVAQGGFRRIEL
jgi:hypothetical protein